MATQIRDHSVIEQMVSFISEVSSAKRERVTSEVNFTWYFRVSTVQYSAFHPVMRISCDDISQ